MPGYPTWHRAYYADALPQPRPARAVRAWRRLRALLRGNRTDR